MRPVVVPQQRPYPAVAVARVLSGEGDRPVHQSRVFGGLCRDVALAGAGLVYYLTSPALGDLKPLLQMLHSSSSPSRAQKFPRLTSLSISMSSSFSASSFLRRAFSFSSSLRRLASEVLIPPYWFLQRWKEASLMPRSLAVSGTVAPAASLASAWRSLRTICSGECRLPITSPPYAHPGLLDSHSSWTSFRGAGQHDT